MLRRCRAGSFCSRGVPIEHRLPSGWSAPVRSATKNASRNNKSRWPCVHRPGRCRCQRPCMCVRATRMSERHGCVFLPSSGFRRRRSHKGQFALKKTLFAVGKSNKFYPRNSDVEIPPLLARSAPQRGTSSYTAASIMGASTRHLMTVNGAAVVVMLLSAAMYTRCGCTAHRNLIMRACVPPHHALQCSVSRLPRFGQMGRLDRTCGCMRWHCRLSSSRSGGVLS